MRHYTLFSVGDYELSQFAGSPFAPANYQPKYYNVQTGSTAKPQMGPPAPKEIFGPPRSAGIRPQMGPPAPKEIFGPPRSAAPVKKGIRKAHIRNVKGKIQMVGQSIMKAGKATAGALKANPGKAGAIGAGVVAVGGGATYLLNRKKKQRI